jgi:hypothetical protein
MQTQNYDNHRRWVFPYHILTGAAIGFLFVQSLIDLIHDSYHVSSSAFLFVLISLILMSFYIYARQFSLKAQDRAIRAEESLRHFILTGKPLYKELTMPQIIALRFASDEEFAGLAKRAADEALSSNEIKKAIRNWRADHSRV